MKYLFEVNEEITGCGKCPIQDYESFEFRGCRLELKEVSESIIPDWCPLQKVDDVLDELKESLEADKSVYHPCRHCGNCEHGNKYKEQEPCNSCTKQSNWKKRIFY